MSRHIRLYQLIIGIRACPGHTVSFGMKTMKTKEAVSSRGTNKSAHRCLLSRLMLLPASSQTRLGGTLMKVKQLLRLLLGDKHPKLRFFQAPLADVNVVFYCIFFFLGFCSLWMWDVAAATQKVSEPEETSAAPPRGSSSPLMWSERSSQLKFTNIYYPVNLLSRSVSTLWNSAERGTSER